MFEKISKGEFKSSDNTFFDDDKNVYKTRVDGFRDNYPKYFCGIDREESKENAEFIACCFNLQQRYDISKLEEAVKALEYVFEKDGYLFIGELLKQIKR